MLLSILAICSGASAGALIRWGLNESLNWLFPAMPPGTLVANLLGSLIMGFAVAWFSCNPDLNPQWRLLLITGFLGSLTTFSAFAAEISAMISSDRLLLCAGAISLHVGGSICMVFLGMGLFSLLRKCL